MAKIQVTSPIDDAVVGTLPAMTKADIDQAFAELKKAQTEWVGKPLAERAKVVQGLANVLRDNADELADLLVREIGKTPEEAAGEVTRTAELVEATVAEVKKFTVEQIKAKDFPGWRTAAFQHVSRVPWGVVLAISPYNYPINLSVSKIAPALLMGNAVLFKPSTQGAVTAGQMIELWRKAGLPAEVVQMVTGQTNEIGDYLTGHEGVDLVAMTGSTDVGQKIAEHVGMIPLMLELGGNDPAIVLADADLDLAADTIVHGAFKYAGQRCTAVKRVYVVTEVADKLTEKIVAKTKELFPTTGDPRKHPVGPVISDQQADYVEEILKDAKTSGGKVLVGGQRTGRMIEATVIDGLSHDTRLVAEEQFGPVLPIVKVPDVDEAVRLANDTPYGLQASVFSGDRQTADEIAARLEAGGVHVNGPDQRGPDNFLFIGHKASGFGPQGVRFALEGMANLKGVVHNER